MANIISYIFSKEKLITNKRNRVIDAVLEPYHIRKDEKYQFPTGRVQNLRFGENPLLKEEGYEKKREIIIENLDIGSNEHTLKLICRHMEEDEEITLLNVP